jgi:hypothetical protein
VGARRGALPGWADRGSFYDLSPLVKRDEGKGADKIDLDDV